MERGKRLALVVATDDFVDARIPNLGSPRVDAEELAEVLGDGDLGDFAVEVAINQTNSEVASRLEGFLVEAGPDDLVLLHFSTHGLKDQSGELFLAATNTSPDRLLSTGIDAAYITRLMRRSRARSVVLFLDCCFGGAFERGSIVRAGGEVDVADQFQLENLGGGRGRAVVTASSAIEYAVEGSTLTQETAATPSVFTRAIVDGIRTGAADHDEDGWIQLGELYDHVFDSVRAANPHQTPCKWEYDLRGRLAIARSPRLALTPAELDPDLVALTEQSNPLIRLTAIHELSAIAKDDDLRMALAAAEHLRASCNDDSRRVSEAASRSFAELALEVSPSTIEVGELEPGASTTGHVALVGPPVSRHVEVVNQPPWLDVAIEAGQLTATIRAPDQVGHFSGLVHLIGPVTDLEVTVRGSVAHSRHRRATRRREPAPVEPDVARLSPTTAAGGTEGLPDSPVAGDLPAEFGELIAVRAIAVLLVVFALVILISNPQRLIVSSSSDYGTTLFALGAAWVVLVVATIAGACLMWRRAWWSWAAGVLFAIGVASTFEAVIVHQQFGGSPVFTAALVLAGAALIGAALAYRGTSVRLVPRLAKPGLRQVILVGTPLVVLGTAHVVELSQQAPVYLVVLDAIIPVLAFLSILGATKSTVQTHAVVGMVLTYSLASIVVPTVVLLVDRSNAPYASIWPILTVIAYLSLSISVLLWWTDQPRQLLRGRSAAP